MNNKRFNLAYEKGNWWAVNDSGITLWKEEVIYLLNKQDEYITVYPPRHAPMSFCYHITGKTFFH